MKVCHWVAGESSQSRAEGPRFAEYPVEEGRPRLLFCLLPHFPCTNRLTAKRLGAVYQCRYIAGVLLFW
jgi:hypothetical protein